jgi:urease accessory protein
VTIIGFGKGRSVALGFVAAALVSSPAFAHTFGAAGSGFAEGVVHPFLGVDHVLAMVAVGLWSAALGGRARWLVPAGFVVAMAFGAALGMAAIPLPAGELGIALSVLVFGLLIGLRSRLPLLTGMALVAAFAVFHGHAHGAEAPTAAAPALYMLGFAFATASLHLTGLGLGLLVDRHDTIVAKWFARVSGGAIAAAGVALAII